MTAGVGVPVGVSQHAAIQLVNFLANAGRSINPRDAMETLVKVMRSSWGTPSAVRFEDSFGGGWTIEMTPALRGLEAHAVVRTISENGTQSHQLVDIIDSDAHDQKAFPAPTGDPSAAVAAAPPSVPQTRPAPPPPPVQQGPEDPVLILYVDDAYETKMERTTRGELPDAIAKLIRDGFSPNQIEVWTGMKKPQLKIELA